MKFIREVEKGIEGLNEGVPAGLPTFDKKIYNTQHKKIIGLVGSAKAGKTAMMLLRYIVYPYLSKANIKWIWYSLEMSRNQMIARLISIFADIHSFNEFKSGVSKIRYQISEAAILGMGEERLTSDEFNYVKKINEIYIEPLMGVEDDNGNITVKGKVDFIEDFSNSNPTGVNKYLTKIALDNGDFRYETYHTTEGEKKRIVGYTPKDDTKIWVIVDHLGLMKKENQHTTKENIDKFVNEYAKTLRNLCGFTFILLSQLNRGIKGIDRMKFSGEELQPSAEDIKDSSALEETADIIFAIFNPNTYTHLKKHLGYDLNLFNGSYRSIHVITSRYTPTPINKSLYFNNKTGRFIELLKTTDPGFKLQMEGIKQLNLK